MIHQKATGSKLDKETNKEKEVYLVIENSLEDRVKELRRRLAHRNRASRSPAA